MPDIVLTRLLGEAAHRHVLDHACAQRADAAIGKIGEHRGSSLEQKVAGPSMLGTGGPNRHALPLTASPIAHRRGRAPLPRERVRSMPPTGRSDGAADRLSWGGKLTLSCNT